MLSTLTRSSYAIPFLILTGSAVPLGFALASQYIFGLHPCELCVWQRLPYAALIGIGMLAMLVVRRTVWLKRILVLAIILWAIEATLGVYHFGVEQKWWQSATGCTAGSEAGQSLEDIRAAILKAPVVSCDQPEFVFLGLSMAAWNIVVAAGFALSGTLLHRRMNNLA